MRAFRPNIVPILAALLAAVSINSPALARLGESVAQLDARYGKPKEISESDPSFVPGAHQRTYEFNGFVIVVRVLGGSSQFEYLKPSSGDAISRDQLETILAANSPTGEWMPLTQSLSSGGEWFHRYKSTLDQARKPELQARVSLDQKWMEVFYSSFFKLQEKAWKSTGTAKTQGF